jgi:acyl-coenzyme A synthetase/AMP-(fatty) acid ligase
MTNTFDVEELRSLGARTAVIDTDGTYSYLDLANEIDRVTELLEINAVGQSSPVALYGDFGFSQIAAFLALHMRRNIIIPVVTFPENARDAVLNVCAAKAIVDVSQSSIKIDHVDKADSPQSDFYSALRETNASGLVLLSSGSTGVPKAMLHNLDLIFNEKVGSVSRYSKEPRPVLLFLLADHIGGVNSLLGVLRSRGTAVVPATRTPEEICGLIEKHRIRLLPTSPTFLNLLLLGSCQLRFDLSSLVMITYGTEPMPEALLSRLHKELPHVRFVQTFGTSETGVSTTQSESSSSTFFKFDDQMTQHRVVNGELQLKTKTQFLGYLNYANEALTDDGWFKTGDLVDEGSDGYFRIKGRVAEVINVGGEKVLPLELESILVESPLISDCTVYGSVNAITGQAVHVDIVPEGSVSKLEMRQHVRDFLVGRVENFKIPTRISIVTQIGVTARFKKDRNRQHD